MSNLPKRYKRIGLRKLKKTWMTNFIFLGQNFVIQKIAKEILLVNVNF